MLQVLQVLQVGAGRPRSTHVLAVAADGEADAAVTAECADGEVLRLRAVLK